MKRTEKFNLFTIAALSLGAGECFRAAVTEREFFSVFFGIFLIVLDVLNVLVSCKEAEAKEDAEDEE